MNIFSVRSFKLVCAAAAATVALNSCTVDKGGEIIDDKDSKLEVPNEYTFESRFDAGTSSVFYGGQTVRQLLIKDVKALISDAATTGNANFKDDFLALYNYADASDLSTSVSTGNYSPLVAKYSGIATGKNLGGKISQDLLIGYDNMTAEDLILSMVDAIQANIVAGKQGSAVYIDETTKVDYQQMIEKVLHGAVSFSQASGHYLSIAPTENNVDPKSETSPYSVQEHVWDEAFGYFGGARDYFAFSDMELAGKEGANYRDINADNAIDFQSEYNFGISTNAGKRDINHSTNFTADIFNAFLAGRTAIVNGEDTETIAAHATNASHAWERVIAATVIHYINETIADMDGDMAGTADHSKHWSELKGFMIGLQYGGEAYRLMTPATLEDIQTKIGNQPVVAAEGLEAYKATLLDVRATLQGIYSFNSADVATW